MTNWKYTNENNDVAFRINDDGSTISILASALEADTLIDTADLPDPQIAINQEALAYLASTDWYVIRGLERAIPIPEEILTLRQEARDSIV